MYKKLILLAALYTTILIRAQEDQNLDTCLASYNQTYEELSKHIGKLDYTTETIYAGNRAITLYYYHGPQEALNAWNNYKAVCKRLDEKTAQMSLGDGFILGSALAFVNRVINGAHVNKKDTALAITLSSIVLKLHQNKQMGIIPYYNMSLTKKEDWFAQASFNTVSHVLLVMTSATIGFLGVNFAFNRLKN
jgi:hypothetical protein